jgi:hypothetical protein
VHVSLIVPCEQPDCDGTVQPQVNVKESAVDPWTLHVKPSHESLSLSDGRIGDCSFAPRRTRTASSRAATRASAPFRDFAGTR